MYLIFYIFTEIAIQSGSRYNSAAAELFNGLPDIETIDLNSAVLGVCGQGAALRNPFLKVYLS